MPRLLLALILALLALPATATAAPPAVDVRGTWTLQTDYSTSEIVWTSIDCATGAISGSGKSGTITWPEQGTVDGTTLTTVSGPYSSNPTYTYYLSGTFSDADHAAGRFKDSWRGDRDMGAWTLTRVSGPPGGSCVTTGTGPGTGTPPPPEPTPPALHPTATQVMCTYVVMTSLDTCTATVGDAAAQPTSPTGTVSFSAAQGMLLGSTCVLTSSPSAPSTGSCAVTYQRPFGSTAFPEIAAAYSGDATHAASSGATSFLILGGPPTFNAPYPNQLQFETVAEADGTSVTTCATVSSKSTRARSAAADDDLDALIEQIQQADDRTTGTLLPTLEKALAEARTTLERNKAEYEAKLTAGDKAGAAAAKKKVDEATKQVNRLGDALSGQCKAKPAAQRSALASAAAAAPKRKAKRTRTAVVLGTRNIRAAKAGKLPLTLKLAKAKLNSARKGKKTVTVYVHVITRTPSGLVKKGWPRAAIYPVKLDARGRPLT